MKTSDLYRQVFECQFCHFEFLDNFMPGWKAFSVQCPNCKRQSLAASNSEKAWTVKKEDIKTCDYECHFAEPYGFVPEDGCPVHDKL